MFISIHEQQKNVEFSQELISNLQEDIQTAKNCVAKLQQKKEELTQHITSGQLKKHLQLYEEYAEALSKASIYANALYEVNQADEKRNQTLRQVQQTSTDLSEQLIYFPLTLKTFSQEKLTQLRKELPRYDSFLRDIQKHAQYALSEKEEKIINRKDNSGIQIVEKLYGMITSRYIHEIEIDGKQLKLTREELTPYIVSENRETRKKAREALIQPYSKDKTILSEIFSALVTDYDDESKLRGYNKPISSRHLANDIDDEVYQALKTSAQKHQKIFIEYLEIKKQLLGYKELRAYDIRANITGLPEGLEYEQAQQQVLRVFESYADWLGQGAKTMFENNRIDVHPRANKRGGACCIGGLPNDLPLLILNHTQTYEALKTLAHEMGHAVHAILAQHNSIFAIQSQIVLAESASNLAETLLFEDTLKQADKQEQIALLCNYLDDCIASIPVQLKYTRFEEWAHGNIQQSITPTQLSQQWAKLTKQDFPNITIPELESDGWLAIPHIYQAPFYCYGYSFGILVALALYKQATPNQVKEILSAGSSKEPYELLKEYGLDIKSEAFWDAGFEKIQSLVDQLQTLI